MVPTLKPLAALAWMIIAVRTFDRHGGEALLPSAVGLLYLTGAVKGFLRVRRRRPHTLDLAHANIQPPQ